MAAPARSACGSCRGGTAQIAAHENTFIDRELLAHPDPEVVGAMSSLLHEVAAVQTRRLDTWLATTTSWSQEWQSSADISDHHLRLTPARARALSAELDEVIARHRALAIRERPGESTANDEQWARVELQLRVFPRPPA